MKWQGGFSLIELMVAMVVS
ncbi:prepilin-type N-terminal cleavage/methylation domain-containing protein, partial [uncultured Halomonas sp.]